MNREALLEDAVLIALRRIIRAVDLRSRSLMLDIGLTVPQLAALQAVGRGQPMTAGEVAREIHVGQPTVTGILDRLERRRLIQRLRGTQDRRQVNVVLTPEGQQVLQGAPSVLQDHFRRNLGQLADWERTQILATLQRIAGMMEFPATAVERPLGGELSEAVR